MKVLELAARHAQRLAHGWIGTEHLLLGLIAEQTGIAAEVLGEHGVTVGVVEREADRLEATGPER
jgi:ATP-dependent Clp protease ATP-binding subunit ClpC